MDLYRKTREYILLFFDVEQDVPCSLSKQTAGHNNMIVREIAEYLPLADLKRFRFISHDWNYSVSDAYFRASSVTLHSLDKLTKYTEEMEPSVHSNFNLESLQMSDIDQISTLQPFFEKYGNQILNLQITLRLRTTTGIENLQGFFGLLRTLKNAKELDFHLNFWGPLPGPYVIPVLPSLQRILIDIMNYDNSYGRIAVDPIASSLANVVLTMAPNLQHLLIRQLMLNGYQETKEAFWRHFLANVSFLPPLHLKKLEFRGTYRILTTLLKIPIPLTHLRIRMLPEFEVGLNAYKILHDFLEIHSTTLESLFIDVYPKKTSGVVRIPLELPNIFPNLVDLQLRFTSVVEKPEFPMTPMINYPERFPKLKTLWVLTNPHKFQEEIRKIVHDVMFPDGGDVCHSVRTVRLQVPSHTLKKFCHRLMIGKMFPNAEILSSENFIPVI